jgi:membrane-bound lytic murein transglycosylase A
MVARQAGRGPRPARRNRPRRQLLKHHAAKHPVAKRRATRAAAQRLIAARQRLAETHRSFAFASAGVLLLLASCAQPTVEAPPAHRLALVATDFDALPGWRADHVAEAIPALQRSCDAFAKQPEAAAVGKTGIAGLVQEWMPACEAAAALPAGDDTSAAQFLTDYFRPYVVLDQAPNDGLFTGYYEMELDGARKPGGDYRVPLYKAPDSPVTYSRAEIDAGALKNRNLELMWLKDPVDVFMLQIQGSAVVKLPDGTLTRVGYAGNNGRDFVPVGKLMIQGGVVPKDKASAQGIRDWLRAHPKDGQLWMQKNPRYIFFRELGADAAALPGPSGALGVTLTPMRSMAVDPAFLPLGAPLWLDTKAPDGTVLQRLMVAQDVGSAIKGPIRGDLFWGTGAPALEFAGRMKSNGRYYVLLPKAAAHGTVILSDLGDATD